MTDQAVMDTTFEKDGLTSASSNAKKAHVGQGITSWRAVTAMPVAVRYNSMNRDKNYARKLSHAYDLISQGQRASCAR